MNDFLLAGWHLRGLLLAFAALVAIAVALNKFYGRRSR